MPAIGRRRFLAATLASAVALVGCRRGAGRVGPAASPLSLERFLSWSARLTGRSNLDAESGRIYLEALLTNPQNAALLEALAGAAPGARAPTEAHAALEREVLAAWYTSVCVVNGKRHAASHAGALMWQAVGLPAPGSCAGAAGSWSSPPGRSVSR